MIILILIAIVCLVGGYLLGMYVCWMADNNTNTGANERIELAVKECMDLKNIAQEYIDGAKKRVDEYKNIIEKQQHLIEMLKMKLREK